MGIVPERDWKCENSRQVGMGLIQHPEVQNGSKGRFLRRHEVGGRVQIRVPPEWAADHRHHQLWAASTSSPVFIILWKVSWVIWTISLSVSTSRNKERNYLKGRRVVSIT